MTRVPYDIRHKAEVDILTAIAKAAVEAGYEVGAWNGGGYEESRGTNVEQIVTDAMLGDEGHLRFYKPKQKRNAGYVFFVLGESGWDVVCDYTCNVSTLFDTSKVSAIQRQCYREITNSPDCTDEDLRWINLD